LTSNRSTDLQRIGFLPVPEDRVNYLCLTFRAEAQASDLAPASDAAKQSELVTALAELKQSGNLVAAASSIPPATSTTVRVRNGRMVLTDGPATASREYLAGFAIISARDLNEAVRIAARNPVARFGSIEVHPLPDLDVEPLAMPVGDTGFAEAGLDQ
jgi:hypothetical protein